MQLQGVRWKAVGSVWPGGQCGGGGSECNNMVADLLPDGSVEEDCPPHDTQTRYGRPKCNTSWQMLLADSNMINFCNFYSLVALHKHLYFIG